MLIKLNDDRCMPKRTYANDAGVDLVSLEYYTLQPNESHMFDTGVAVQIPVGYVGLVFNRSSQGKLKVQLNNSVGVIDSDYRGNIKVLLSNNGNLPYDVKAFDTRIAQLVVVPVSIDNLIPFTGTEEEWIDTTRGTGGFGSTGA